MRVKAFDASKVEIKNAKGDGHSHVEVWVNGEKVGYMHICGDFADFFNTRRGEPYKVKSYK